MGHGERNSDVATGTGFIENNQQKLNCKPKIMRSVNKLAAQLNYLMANQQTRHAGKLINVRNKIC